ncbi:MAG: YicC family protein [Gammaproteobacteria bacterium]|nr:YicC family protein [Gammaproteobacteria bacterium]
MTRSMTAFARQSDEQTWGTLVWEIRSVNHRYLDVFVKIPEELRSLEMQVREAVAKYLQRGKVEVALRFKAGPNVASELEVNEALSKALVKGCQVINKQLHQPSEMNPMDILRWPGVVEEPEHDLKPVLQAAMSLLEKSLTELVEVRQNEGQRMQALVLQRRQAMVEIVASERSRRPQIIQAQREKILARLAELKAEPDMDRFEQELVYLTQKMDVDEELDRLDSHFQELVDIFKRDEAIGRRLDFIMQELNREANTLGSKSVDITTTQASVELKVLIEQMREQVQNIE